MRIGYRSLLIVPFLVVLITSCSSSSSTSQKPFLPTGKPVITPQFDAAYDFVDGLALVRIGKQFGYIDKTGKYLTQPQFDDAFGFADGLARAQSGEKWGYIS